MIKSRDLLINEQNYLDFLRVYGNAAIIKANVEVLDNVLLILPKLKAIHGNLKITGKRSTIYSQALLAIQGNLSLIHNSSHIHANELSSVEGDLTLGIDCKLHLPSLNKKTGIVLLGPKKPISPLNLLQIARELKEN